jgi:tRNA A-37 threonylcarbamoyl transferase component Bud32
MTEEIRSCGIPTVQSIGAIHQRIFYSVYQAYFISLEATHAKDLTQYFQEIGAQPTQENLLLKRKTIRSVGFLIRQFHKAGFFHGDLQLKNILVAGDQILLIDFDRSYRKPTLPVQRMMKNLLRLNRSVEKWKRRGLPITRTDRWRFFLAYAGNDQKIREVMARTFEPIPFASYFIDWAGRLKNSAG